MRKYDKRDFPVDNVRRHLEPGPIVLVSSAWRGKTNIMTMGWHMVMGFEPSLIGCYIWSENHSFDMVRKSRECVINIPTVDLGAKVVAIGNSSGRNIDKFTEFGLTAVPGTARRRAADRGMLRELRVQARRCEAHSDPQPVCLRGGQGACGGLAQISPHHALPGRWGVHAVGREHGQVSQGLQAAESVRASCFFPLPLPWCVGRRAERGRGRGAGQDLQSVGA
jgi:flavin reductase like protein